MVDIIEPAILGTAAVAGFEVARRFVPNTGLLGTYNDLAFGVAVFGIGYVLHSKALLAAGVGAILEGTLTALGF